MNNQIFKKIISFALICIFVFGCFPLTAFASEQNKVHTFTSANGETVEYYIDSEGNPYYIQNGEKIYLMLPVNSKAVTDEALLSKLNTVRTAPTSYYSLMQKNVSETSNVYTQYMTLENGGNRTATLKKYTAHSIIRIRTADLGKPSVFSSKKVNIILMSYLEPSDQWFETKLNNVDATAAAGIALNATSGVNYFYVVVSQANNPVWFTLNVWTFHS